MTARADMKSAAKFTVTCDRCGKKVARNVTDWTANKAMGGHEQSHRLDDQVVSA